MNANAPDARPPTITIAKITPTGDPELLCGVGPDADRSTMPLVVLVAAFVRDFGGRVVAVVVVGLGLDRLAVVVVVESSATTGASVVVVTTGRVAAVIAGAVGGGAGVVVVVVVGIAADGATPGCA